MSPTPRSLLEAGKLSNSLNQLRYGKHLNSWEIEDGRWVTRGRCVYWLRKRRRRLRNRSNVAIQFANVYGDGDSFIDALWVSKCNM